MDQARRVFISHTSDMAAFPHGRSFVNAVLDATLRSGGYPVDMAYFPAREGSPAEFCMAQVRHSDIYIGVIGFRYGSLVPERDISYTELEFQTATEAGIPRLIFVLDEDAPMPPILIDTSRGPILGFRERLYSAGVIAMTFRAADELESAVLHALAEIRSPVFSSRASSPSIWNVPTKVGRVIRRTELEDQLFAKLHDQNQPDTAVVLAGRPGYGKTTLAAEICRAPSIARRFPGGVLWINGSGQTDEASIAAHINDLSELISGQRPGFTSPAMAGAHLGRVLDQMQAPALLVLDDMRSSSQLQFFLIGGRHCQRLLTTRQREIVPAHFQMIDVDAMTLAEAALTLDSDLDFSPQLRNELLELSGGWPLLLALMNAIIREYVQAGASADEAGRRVSRILTDVGPSGLDTTLGPNSLSTLLEESIGYLSDEEFDLYLDLITFPSSGDVDVETICRLWSARVGLTRHAADRVIDKLTRTHLASLTWVGDKRAIGPDSLTRSHLRRIVGSAEIERRESLICDSISGEDTPPSAVTGEASVPPARLEDTPARPRPSVLIVYPSDESTSAERILSGLEGLRHRGIVDQINLYSVDGDFIGRDSTSEEIVLVLVSQLLISMGFTDSKVMEDLLSAHAIRTRSVFPVLLRPVYWGQVPLGKMPALPPGGRPMSLWESQDEAVQSIVDHLRIACLELYDEPASGTPDATSDEERPEMHSVHRLIRPSTSGVYSLAQVFKKSGVPTLTFVEPPDYLRLILALEAPGRGIVVEGPSGIGKTTLVRTAIERSALANGEVLVLSARRPADLLMIKRLLSGHEGTVVIDDFHRMSTDMRIQLLDYLKSLADEESESKLVIVGIPGTGDSLVDLGFDVATRIDVFRLPSASSDLVLEVVKKGEAALNIRFDQRAHIVLAAGGSLLTAQMLCWELAALSGIKQTQPSRTRIPAGVEDAIGRVLKDCERKYAPFMKTFSRFGEPSDTTCMALLEELAASTEGVLDVAEFRLRRKGVARSIDHFLDSCSIGATGSGPYPARDHLHYDPACQLLVTEDPQLLFYLRNTSTERLIQSLGKRVPRPRDRIFVSYSHRDTAWLRRLEVHLKPLVRDRVIDLWSDQRLRAGDRWREEIAEALDRAYAAVLLVSADFLASDFIHDYELSSIFAAAEHLGCRVISVNIGPSLFEMTPSLSQLHAVNPPSRPLSMLPPHQQDEVFRDLAAMLLDNQSSD